MAIKKIFVLIMLVLVVGAAVSCMTLFKRRRPDGLYFVGGDKSEPRSPVAIGLVVVTHGWIEQGSGDWPEDMAVEINKRVDPDIWLCGYFDWSDGAMTLNATSAAKHARDVAGPKLAKEILKLGCDFEHIHLIGHSGGCWAVSEAAKIIARETKANLHLTFLDAYVPVFWQERLLGDANVPEEVNCWAEHYYTRDYTLGWTQQDLSFAHNVDITSIDSGLKDHNFPWRWYYATISGEFPKGYFLDDCELVWTTDGIEYGFSRSREAAGRDNWNQSLKLPIGNDAVKFKKP